MATVGFEVQDGDLGALKVAKNRLDNLRSAYQNNVDGAATDAQRGRAVMELEAMDAALRVVRAAVVELEAVAAGNRAPVTEVAPSVGAAQSAVSEDAEDATNAGDGDESTGF
jgi:hypothetical protein